MHLLFPTSVAILKMLDLVSMRIWLGGCQHALTGELQNKSFAEFAAVVLPLCDNKLIGENNCWMVNVY